MNKKFLLSLMCTFSSYAAQNKIIYRTETKEAIEYSITEPSVTSHVTIVATFFKKDGIYTCNKFTSLMDGHYLMIEESGAKEIFQSLQFSWLQQQPIEYKRQTR